ncbi:MAG: ABC transporter permease [Armatimonadetes bacterium]|nr:ABC transporter permease [Armatimonadota bacterium]
MRTELKELWRFRELLFSMVEREIRIRYKNSFFGFFWSLLNPLVTIAVMTVVFKFILDNPMESFSSYILAAYLPYMFFQLAILDSAQSVIASLPVVKKVYFPREILPLASLISNFIHLLLALMVFFVYRLVLWAIFRGPAPFTSSILLLPIVLLIQLALTVGVGFIVSALNTFYEDVKYITAVVLYLLFFVCPIMYFSETVAAASIVKKYPWIYAAYHLNPIAMLCTAYRNVLVPSRPVYVKGAYVDPIPLDWGMLGFTGVLSLVVLVGGYAMFNRMKWRFVERP